MPERQRDEPQSRATAATTKRTKVPLDEIVFDTERYCHRDPESLGAEGLASLPDSLTLDVLQVPIEFVADEQGKNVFIKGHKRASAAAPWRSRAPPADEAVDLA